MYTVYKHTAPNNKVYIGITICDVKDRWQNGYGYKRNNHFFRAIKKYGWDNIEHSILFENLSKEEAEQKEIELIAQYRSNQREYGYNIENGGNCIGKISEETKEKLRRANLGKKMSEETKMKISESLSGEKNYLYEKHLSEETKKKLSEAHKGKKSNMYGKHHSEEAKEKMRKARLGKKMSEETKEKLRRFNLGLKHSEETRKKMSEQRKGNKNPMYGRTGENNPKSIPVICVETNIVYPSAVIASRELNLHISNITRVCRGKRKTTGGFHFKYAN